jgi:hypothetical protein
MPDLQAVSFDFEEGFVTGQFLGWQSARRQGQSRGGVGFNLLEQFLHLEISLGGKEG